MVSMGAINEAIMSAVLLVLLLLSSLGRITNSLSVNTFPSVLFSKREVVLSSGSVVLLYCDVDSADTNLVVHWRKDEIPIVQNAPHIRLRIFSSRSSTTLRLIVENFGISDNGAYNCFAQTRSDSVSSDTLTLTALVRQQKFEQLILIDSRVTPPPIQNRIGTERGDIVTIMYDVGYQGNTQFQPPTPVWLLNGRPFRVPPSTSAFDDSGRVQTSIGFEFSDSDRGVFQCVFITSSSRPAQAYTTEPFRIDAGNPSIQPVTDNLVALQNDRKLILEIAASGRFRFINWTRNDLPIGTAETLSNFGEIFHKASPRIKQDEGVYRAELVPFDRNQESVNRVIFAIGVDLATPTITRVSKPASLLVKEGLSLDISCTSRGIPTPTITWTLNDRPAQFKQTDSSITWRFLMNGNEATFMAGTRNSTLHLRSISYPDDNGRYSCIGANDLFPDGSAFTFIVTIVVLDIELVADRTVLGIGYAVVLTCNIIRGNPTTFSYRIRQLGTTNTLNQDRSLNSVSLVLKSSDQFGSYRCEASNGQLTRMSDITLTREQGVAAMVVPRIEPFKEFYSTGDIITVFCDIVRGDLPIAVSLVLPSGRRLIRYTPNPMSLTLASFGTYTCVASNSIGDGSSEIQILQPSRPVIDTAPQNITLEATCPRLFEFRCAASGLPRPTISWTYSVNGIQLVIDNDTVKLRMITFVPQQVPSDSESTMISMLTISNGPCDQFRVSCVASNREGSDIAVALARYSSSFSQAGIIGIASASAGLVLAISIVVMVFFVWKKCKNFNFRDYSLDDYSYNSREDEMASIYSRQHVLPVRLPSVDHGQPKDGGEADGEVQQTMSIVIDYCGKHL